MYNRNSFNLLGNLIIYKYFRTKCSKLFNIEQNAPYNITRVERTRKGENMKRKIFTTMLVACLCVCSTFALTACKKKSTGGEMTDKQAVELVLNVINDVKVKNTQLATAQNGLVGATAQEIIDEDYADLNLADNAVLSVYGMLNDFGKMSEIYLKAFKGETLKTNVIYKQVVTIEEENEPTETVTTFYKLTKGDNVKFYFMQDDGTDTTSFVVTINYDNDFNWTEYFTNQIDWKTSTPETKYMAHYFVKNSTDSTRYFDRMVEFDNELKYNEIIEEKGKMLLLDCSNADLTESQTSVKNYITTFNFESDNFDTTNPVVVDFDISKYAD